MREDKTFTGTLQVGAAFDHWEGEKGNFVPQGVEIRLTAETRERALEVAAQFPKAVKFRGFGVSWREGDYGGGSCHANLKANGVNGGINEGGLKRYRRLLKEIEKLGYKVEWVAPYRNSFATEEAFEAALAASIETKEANG